MRKMLEYQADRIEAVLAHHNVGARVTGGTVTPRWIRYTVLPELGERISTIYNLSEELAAALDVGQVRIARRGAAVQVEAPREDARPVRLLPLLEDLRGVPPVTAVLGLGDDGVPTLVRLPSPEVAHVLVAGTTGSGKTALLRTMAISLALQQPQPGRLALLLVDPKGRAFDDLVGLAHLARPVIVEVDEAIEALGSLVRLMERRDQRGESEPPVVLFVDELTDLMMVGGQEAEERLTRLLQRGREAGVHVVAATQKPTAAVIGTLIKANFPVRLVGKVASPEDAKVASGWKGTGAERLLGRGDFVGVAEGRTFRFQAAYVTRAEAGELLARRGLLRGPIAPAGGNGRSPGDDNGRSGGDDGRSSREPIVLPSPPDPEPGQVEELVLELEKMGWDAWQSYNDAFRALFPDQEPGGRLWYVVRDAVERLRESTSTSTSTSEKSAEVRAGANGTSGSGSGSGIGPWRPPCQPYGPFL